MSNINYTKFKDSLKRLEERYKDYQVSLTHNELLFKNAFASKVIDSAEVWIQFNIKRGNTSLDYSGEKANDTFEIISSFIAEAINLYETISKEKWQ